MKLASGIAPVPDFLDAGVPCGLGTDGCASNNDLDLFGEMHTAALLHKVHRMDPTVLDAATVVRMATIGGARALGLGKSIGSLERGKQADVIVLDTGAPHLVPLYRPASHLVHAAAAGDVRHVMIAGRWVVRDRSLLTMDLPGILGEAGKLGREISGRE
jgi:5-methylthioadenosine/S-adenosylhomocysteine deaminase